MHGQGWPESGRGNGFGEVISGNPPATYGTEVLRENWRRGDGILVPWDWDMDGPFFSG